MERPMPSRGFTRDEEDEEDDLAAACEEGRRLGRKHPGEGVRRRIVTEVAGTF